MRPKCMYTFTIFLDDDSFTTVEREGYDGVWVAQDVMAYKWFEMPSKHLSINSREWVPASRVKAIRLSKVSEVA